MYKKMYNTTMGTPKIKNASSFRADLFETLKEVSEGKPHIITHNAGEPVVLIPQSEYDKMLDEQEFLRDVAVGATELEEGKGLSHTEALKRFDKMKAKWK